MIAHAALCLLFLGAAFPALGDWTPSRPLRIVVPFAPGGQPDVVARALAQTGARRSPLIAGVPTVAEQGYPGYEAGVWMALMAPAGTPGEAIARLHSELARIIRDPAMKASLWDRQWIDPLGASPQQTSAIIREETSRWMRAARS